MNEEEYNTLLEYAEKILAIRPEEKKSMHFASRIGASQYIDILQDIKENSNGKRILDWGSGYGQNSLLLQRAAFDVYTFDVRKRYRKYFDLAMEPDKLKYTCGEDGKPLPYEDGFFDSVLSCGVLEHVSDEKASLADVRRILKPGGQFFIYHLPNKYSYTEYKNRISGGYYHKRTYTRGEVRRVLSSAGFELLDLKRFHFLPRVFVEGHEKLKEVLDPRFEMFNRLDGLLEKLPPFSFFSTAWQAIARKVD